jgi:hypothetical protein
MTHEEFYLRCAEITGVDHEQTIRSIWYRRNRWNDRKAGNGRFEGIGVIRHYGAVIHIALTHPVFENSQHTTAESALARLEEIFKSS